MPVTQDKAAPYTPASAIMEVIERYRNQGLPTPITAEVLGRAGISESLLARTVYALQALDLTDSDGNPTETFETIRKAPTAQYEEQLQAWLNRAYADVIMFVDPSKDDEVAIRDAFRNYVPRGQQPRMVSLFIGLYAAAGIKSAPSIKVSAPRQRVIQPRKTQATFRKKNSGGAGMPTELPVALSGLLASLPPTGEGWTQDARNKFEAAFGAMLDFCFPIIENDDSDIAEEEVA